MKENKSQVIFNQYLRAKRMYGYFELKVAKGKSFYFHAIEDHQYEGLKAAQEQGLIWKLSDEDRRQKPCDTLCIPPLPAYLVILFDDKFYCIKIAKIVLLRESGHMSIDQDVCERIAEKIIHI